MLLPLVVYVAGAAVLAGTVLAVRLLMSHTCGEVHPNSVANPWYTNYLPHWLRPAMRRDGMFRSPIDAAQVVLTAGLIVQLGSQITTYVVGPERVPIMCATICAVAALREPRLCRICVPGIFYVVFAQNGYGTVGATSLVIHVAALLAIVIAVNCSCAPRYQTTTSSGAVGEATSE